MPSLGDAPFALIVDDLVVVPLGGRAKRPGSRWPP